MRTIEGAGTVPEPGEEWDPGHPRNNSFVVTWPLASYQGSRIPDIPDPASYIWSLWWVAHQIMHLANPWSTGQLAAPAGGQ